MSDLITRLEEAAEGSRELDVAIYAHIKGIADDIAERHWQAFSPVTTSIDAALALAERVLPEMNCIGFDKTPSGVEAYVSRNNVDSKHWVVTGEHPSSPALAICIAILKANHKDKT